MKNIGNTIKKICYYLAGILVAIGIIISCVDAYEVCPEYFYWEYDLIDTSIAFWSSFSLYLGLGFSSFCLGAFFGYLNQICNLLENIKNKQ